MKMGDISHALSQHAIHEKFATKKRKECRIYVMLCRQIDKDIYTHYTHISGHSTKKIYANTFLQKSNVSNIFNICDNENEYIE